MKSFALLREVLAGLLIVLLLHFALVLRGRVASNRGLTTAANITRLEQTLAGLRSLGCSVQGEYVPLGEITARPYGLDGAGRPEACLACLCLVTSDDADPQPECTITNCPSHVCSKNNAYDFDPDHPCCSVCNATEPDPTDEPPRTIDDAIRLTRAVYDRTLLHEPAAVCARSAADSGPPLALLGVTSRPGSTARRALFRRLYGAELAAARLRFVFVLGKETPVERAINQLEADEEEYEDYEPEELTPEEREEQAHRHAVWQRKVDEEAARYGDILQTSTAEHYNHLSLKTLALLDFAGRRCGAAAFVIKTDDDVLVTVRRLAAEVAARAADARRPLIYGHLCVSCMPSRGRMLWRSSHREWPWDRYPEFVTGPGYLVSSAAVRPLVRQALDTPYHHLEDVFLTGIVAQAAGVERRQWDAQCTNRVRGGDLCALSHCALSHSDNYRDGGERMELFAYATRRFDIDELCASNVTMVGS